MQNKKEYRALAITYHVTFARMQTLGSEMQRNHTARASGINSHAGSLEVEEPADSVGDDGVRDTRRFVFDGTLWIGVQKRQMVVIEATGENGRFRSHRFVHGNARFAKTGSQRKANRLR